VAGILFALCVSACSGSSTTAQPTAAATEPTAAAAQPTAALVQPTATAPPTSAPTAQTNTDNTPTAHTSTDGVRLTIDAANSQAQFRAREQLANRSLPSDAIGTNKDVEGAITVSPSGIVPEGSSITVKLDSLQSDSRQRDNFIKQNTLEVAHYPTAQFVPMALHGLALPVPDAGSATFQIEGDLTVHGVTKPTTWDMNATFSPQDVTGSGTTMVTLDQFGMQKPRVFTVLSIDDDITLELDFRAVRELTE
jgi:polyisoprenoid-binding protein YceI